MERMMIFLVNYGPFALVILAFCWFLYVFLVDRKPYVGIQGEFFVSAKQTNRGNNPCADVEDIPSAKICGLDLSNLVVEKGRGIE